MSQMKLTDILKRLSGFTINTSSCTFVNKTTIPLFVAVVVVAGVGCFGWRSYKNFQTCDFRYHEALKLSGVIAHLDEVLTMSANMAAATGNLSWEKRYRQAEPQLDTAIKKAGTLYSIDGIAEYMTVTDTANAELVAMENRAFELVHRGNIQKALALLRSDEYSRQKKLYKEGSDKFTETIKRHAEAHAHKSFYIMVGGILFFAIVVSLMIVSGFSGAAIHREVKLRRRTLEQLKASNQQLMAHEQHLKAVNQKLEFEIAERKKSEEGLEASNRNLKDFVYIASHDLREPSRKVSSFGQILAESLAGKLSDDEQENLDYMIDGAVRMQQMIEALLTYSRVTTQRVDFEPVDLNRVIDELKSFELSVRLEETNARLIIEQPLHTAECDPARIRQLLQNLIANSLKYQAEGVNPEITIRSRIQDNNMVRVEVQDNGIGIREDQFENIFVMFQRLHSRRQYEGTGIGLAVCKKIVSRHGGVIGVSSTFGQGSTFWFTIPAAQMSRTEVVLSNVSETKI